MNKRDLTMGQAGSILFIESEQPYYWHKIPKYREVAPEQWYDWKWQMKHIIRTPAELAEVYDLSDEEQIAAERMKTEFKLGITPYYAAIGDTRNPHCPIRKQSVPALQETHVHVAEMADSLSEDTDMPVPFLVHRYPDRVLFLITDYCTVYCRFCTRRRFTSQDEKPRNDDLEAAFDYLERNPQIRDVLLSGGDPGTVAEARLEIIMKRLRQIPSIEIIRMGTRIPVVCPMRFTKEFCRFLARFHPFWINTHFNHPAELTPEARQACANIVDAGIPLGNQSVLMRGINDCWHVMKKLCHELVRARVRPYYVYQCDLSEGITHFRVPVSRGIEILENLRGHTSGYAVPTYVIDGVGGAGKIPINPNYMLAEGPDYVLLRNYEGRVIKHPVPVDPPYEAKCPPCCETPEAKPLPSGHALQEQSRQAGTKAEKPFPWREKKKANLQILG